MKRDSDKEVAIIHYLPVELYPPATNLLNFISQSHIRISLYTTHNLKNRIPYSNSKTTIHRYVLPEGRNIIVRFWKYVNFNISVAFKLARLAPANVLYYESFSSFPVFLYHLLFNRKAKLYLHYHEYLSLDWYKRNMVLLRFFNFIERHYLYHKLTWISHTNEMRKRLFLNDNSSISPSIVKILPNYPPQSWSDNHRNRKNKEQGGLNFVYVGTLSMDYGYIKEFVEWILNSDDHKLDIYSHSIERKTRQYLVSINSNRVRIFDRGIEYDKIPVVLANYDVGLILYKAVTINYKFNATNKLFEYLACGLDVWFPEEMKGCYDHITLDTYPKVCKIDFRHLSSINPERLADHSNFTYKPIDYSCEEALVELKNELIN